MSVLFSLPDELCRVLISDWIDEELRALDTAVCSHQFCDQLISLLPYVRGYSCSRRGLAMLHWMNARNIKLIYFVLDKKTNRPDWITAVTHQCDHVQDLTIMDNVKMDWINLNSFSNLTSFEWECDDSPYLASVKGVTWSKLAHLSILTLLDLPSLIAIRDNCQQLKSIRVICTPTTSTTPVMIDILRQNSQLTDVDIEINKPLMDALVTYSSRSLKKIYVGGRVDFNTIRYIQEKFDYIETIGFKNGFEDDLSIDFNVTYCKVENSLTLWWRFHTVPGWNGFIAQLPSLRTIRWDRRSTFDMTLEPMLTSHYGSLREIDIRCTTAESSVLKSLLDHCTVLKKFSCVSDKAINWLEVLCDDCKLEELTVGGPCSHLIEILKSCRYLSTLTFQHNTLFHVPSSIAAIREYRHCVTGQSLRFCHEFQYRKEFIYDGREFSGSLWDSYCNTAKDRIKELEEELKTLKDHLAQNDEEKQMAICNDFARNFMS